MKRIFFTLILLLSNVWLLKAAELSALLTYCTFTVPSGKPYVETYLSVAGNTATFLKKRLHTRQAAIDIGITFTQDGAIKAFKKYTLISPEVSDTAQLPFFIDQQRFPLENGDYLLELSITDKNKPGSQTFYKKEHIRIDYPAGKINLSDIELLESYATTKNPGILSKSGYDLQPYIANFYPQNLHKLVFYTECYNLIRARDGDQKYILLYFLENYQNAQKLESFGGFSKIIPREVSVVLSEMDIDKLPSGQYNLVLELRDQENKIIAFKKTYFQRGNPVIQSSEEILAASENEVDQSFVGRFKSNDSLIDLLRSTRPIASDIENSIAENEIKSKDIKAMQRRLLIFWKTHVPANPELGFETYTVQVQAVQHSFGTRLQRGYNTDRGRVYLKYGAPSSRQIADKEPGAYPYEIWTYNSLPDKQTNRKFVFYEPDLVTNNYMLLHSDAKGEIFNAGWEIIINKRGSRSTNLDDTQNPDHYGGNASDDFNHPK
jgi:GWxTD domain-containing protein